MSATVEQQPCFNALSHQSIRSSIRQCILGTLVYYQGTQVFQVQVNKLKLKISDPKNKIVESQKVIILIKVNYYHAPAHTLKYQISVG